MALMITPAMVVHHISECSLSCATMKLTSDHTKNVLAIAKIHDEARLATK